MFNRRTLLLVTSCSVCLSFNASADYAVSTTIHPLYQSARAMGMGDAFTAVADDYSAVMYNPAGLARREDSQMNLAIGLGASSNFNSTYNQISGIQNGNGSSTDKETDLLNVIQNNYGKTYSARIEPLEAFYVRPKWGIAFIPADVSLEMTMHELVGPSVAATAYADTTLALGYGDDLYWFDHGRLSWGITGKLVNRGFVSKDIDAVDLASSTQVIQKSDLHEGYTVDADIGTLWTPELPNEGLWSVLRLARPTFSGVIRNIAQTGFGHSFHLINNDSSQPPEPLYRTLDLGSHWEYPSMWIFGGRGTLDFRDLGNPELTWRRAVHAGLEFDWTLTSWWKGQYRVGLNDGYWTAGLSAELGIFNLDFVSYANDVGTPNQPIESRLYAVKLNLDF